MGWNRMQFHQLTRNAIACQFSIQFGNNNQSSIKKPYDCALCSSMTSMRIYFQREPFHLYSRLLYVLLYQQMLMGSRTDGTIRFWWNSFLRLGLFNQLQIGITNYNSKCQFNCNNNYTYQFSMTICFTNYNYIFRVL